MYVSTFFTGASANTDYTIDVPADIQENGYMLCRLMVSKNAGGTIQPMDSFYDINYIGLLKTNGIYRVTDANFCNKSARAVWVYW